MSLTHTQEEWYELLDNDTMDFPVPVDEILSDWREERDELLEIIGKLEILQLTLLNGVSGALLMYEGMKQKLDWFTKDPESDTLTILLKEASDSVGGFENFYTEVLKSIIKDRKE